VHFEVLRELCVTFLRPAISTPINTWKKKSRSWSKFKCLCV